MLSRRRRCTGSSSTIRIRSLMTQPRRNANADDRTVCRIGALWPITLKGVLIRRRVRRAAQPCASLLPERPPCLVGQRLEQIRPHRPLIGPDERLDRHSRHQLDAAEALDFPLRDRDANEIVVLVGALILDD